MIIVAGTVRIRPETRTLAVAAATAMATATRRERGCLAYRFAFDIEDANCVHVFEQWASADALMEHFSTSHMGTFRARLAEIIAAPPELTRFVVSASAPLS
jgi:quinol monooxygenase YgiN